MEVLNNKNNKSIALQELEILEQALKESPQHEIIESANYIFSRACYNIGKIKGTDDENLVFRFRNIFDVVTSLLEKEKFVQDNISEVNWKTLKFIEKKLDWSDRASTNYHELDFTDIEFYEEHLLKDFEEKISSDVEGTTMPKNEMSYKQRAFLHGIVRKAKPKVIVEMGVSAGGSASVILNAIRDMEGTKLYSYEFSVLWYPEKKLPHPIKSGFLVKEIIPEQMHKWEFFVGGFASRYLEESLPKEGVDICLLDTAHVNPGEHLNILEILPYMKKNGIIIYHDVVLHVIGTLNDVKCLTCCNSINTLHGKRIYLKTENQLYYPNIGAVMLNDFNDDMLFSLFTNLSLPWEYLFSHEDFEALLKQYAKYYKYDLFKIFVYFYFFYTNGGMQNKNDAHKIADKNGNELKKVMQQ